MRPTGIIRKGEDNNSVFIASNIGDMLLDTGAVSSQITDKNVPSGIRILGNAKSHGFWEN
jgi:hypothetical protein